MSDCSWLFAGRGHGLFMQKATHDDAYMRWDASETDRIVEAIRTHPYGLKWTVGSDHHPELGLHWETRATAYGGEREGMVRMETGLATPATIALPDTNAGRRRMARTIQTLVAGHIHDGLFPAAAGRRVRKICPKGPAPTLGLTIAERDASNEPLTTPTRGLSDQGRYRADPSTARTILKAIQSAPAGVTITWGEEAYREPGLRAEVFRVRTDHVGYGVSPMTWTLRGGTIYEHMPDTPAGGRRLIATLHAIAARTLRTWERTLAVARPTHWDEHRTDAHPSGGEE